MRIDPAIDACRYEFARIRSERARLENEDDDIQRQIQDLFEENRLEEEKLVCGVYSRAVYARYAKKHPLLREVSSGKLVRWQDVFKDPYGATTREQRYALVGLIEGEGAYRFAFPPGALVYLSGKPVWDPEDD